MSNCLLKPDFMGKENKPVVGISFTSRNRPDLLKICLEQTEKYLSTEKFDYIISVINDVGDPKWDEQYDELKKQFPFVIWYKPEERLGIAKAKNEGIKIMRKNCDHLFLSDDDCFPVKEGWEELYIETAKNNNVNHLMHEFPIKERIELVKTENGISKYMGSCGVFLYFTRHAIDVVGGMRKAFKNYGNEHTEIAFRCHLAKLQGKWGPFMSPENSRDYLYAIDLDLLILGVQPKDFTIDLSTWRYTTTVEEIKEDRAYNMEIFKKMEPFFEEI